MTAAAEREDFEAAARARDRLTALRVGARAQRRRARDQAPTQTSSAVVDDELEAAAHVFYVRDGRIAGQRGWVVDKPDPLSTPELTEQLLQEAYGDADPLTSPRRSSCPRSVPGGVSEWLSGVRGAARGHSRRPARQEGRTGNVGTPNAQEVLQQHRLRRASDLTARSAALQDLQDAPESARGAVADRVLRHLAHLRAPTRWAPWWCLRTPCQRRRTTGSSPLPTARDDLGSMREVLRRRFTRYLEESQLPPEERETRAIRLPAAADRRRRRPAPSEGRARRARRSWHHRQSALWASRSGSRRCGCRERSFP